MEGENGIESVKTSELTPNKSFVAVPKDPTIIAATSDYYGRYVCAVQWKNITATQFHPEKSGDYGLCTLKRWLQ